MTTLIGAVSIATINFPLRSFVPILSWWIVLNAIGNLVFIVCSELQIRKNETCKCGLTRTNVSILRWIEAYMLLFALCSPVLLFMTRLLAIDLPEKRL